MTHDPFGDAPSLVDSYAYRSWTKPLVSDDPPVPDPFDWWAELALTLIAIGVVTMIFL